MDKEIYMKNLWNRYQKTKDLKYLIEACENAPFFGNPKMGLEIAEILKKIHHHQFLMNGSILLKKIKDKSLIKSIK